MKKSKKAISPVITTTLLVLVAILLAAMIFFWAKGFIQEKTMKFNQPIENACADVKLQAAISGDGISVINNGDVVLYRLDAQVSNGGSSTIYKNLTQLNIARGFSDVITYSGASLSGTVKVIPVLLGKKEKSGETQEFTCPSQYWQQIE